MATIPITEADLKRAMRDPRYWQSGHPERDDWSAWVTEGWQGLETGTPTEGPGGEKVVRVRAYVRRRGGKTHHVGAYTQTRHSDGEEAAPGLLNISDATEVAEARQPAPSSNGPIVAIFIGGAGDDRPDGPVKGFWTRFADAQENGDVGRTSRYFGWNEQARIEAFIASQPPETRIRLIGHSFGGDTAAEVAANMTQSGRTLDLLVTIDPVGSGRSKGESFFGQVRNGTRRWINVNATGGSVFDPGNVARRMGGAWDTAPRGFADEFIPSGAAHGAAGRMLNSRTERHPTIIDEIVRR